MDLEDYLRELERIDNEIADAVFRRSKLMKEIRTYLRQEDESFDVEEEEVQRFEKLFGREGLTKKDGGKLAEALSDIEKDEELI